MKKILVAGSVVVAFALYSFQQRHEGSQAVTTIASNTTAPTQTTAEQPAATTAPQTTTDTSTTQQTTPASTTKSGYKDGSFTGKAADAYYGNIQVKVIIKNGVIADVVFLQYPNDRRTSVDINAQAMPLLKQEAISAQSANINGVSGATDTSAAFIQSLRDAILQAS